MALQQTISEQLAAEFVGRTLKVVIDRQEGGFYVARSEYSSPEVDPEVLIQSERPLTMGVFYNVKVTGSDEFDLYAELA